MPNTALVEALQSELERTRQVTGDKVGQIFRSLGSYNDETLTQFIDTVEPIVRAGQQRAVALTDAYLSAETGTAPAGLPLQDIAQAVRNGTPIEEVYRRPFVSTWTALADDMSFQEAVNAGELRAAGIANMDVLLAYTQSMVQAGKSGNIVAYQRVANGACCPFCALLDGTFTGPTEPMPIHNNCNCTAAPIMSKDGVGSLLSPGSVVEDVAIHEHGEYGPVVTGAGDHFTNARQVEQKLTDLERWRRGLDGMDLPADTRSAAEAVYRAKWIDRNPNIAAELADSLSSMPGGDRAAAYTRQRF